ncbi:glycosyltransferase family 39 protein [Dyadobacter sp. CY323]|uniref:glycosyltransferase family 39 protein n=1 Tax=Dyadobacter sp. CY323 TaxID=2907302 RepID=UPI001F3A11FA|nr:glycosyltransferase family 39 protein [Dyadobacter sp. CY323]MCE6991673.1 glycosyltransferase family 39 protein [Dyadobacter sp. CY323]
MSSNNSKEKLRSSLILLFIILVGIALRLYHLDKFSIFYDEKSTLLVSQGIVLEGANQKKAFSNLKLVDSEFWKTPAPGTNPDQVLRSFTYTEIYSPRPFTPAEFWEPKSLADYYEAMTRSDIGNSSFYYLILHGWIEAFGLSDYSIRLFSVIFSVLTILVTYLFGRRFFNENTGLIAAGITAFEPFCVAYSHQARNYTLTFFLTLLATYYFLQLIENKAKGRKLLWLYLGYSLTAGLGLLSHFLTISVLIGHALYALLFLRSWKGWVRMAAAAALALSGTAWWLIYGGGQYTLSSLAHQAALYKRTAEESPLHNPFGIVLPATVENVFQRGLPLFGDLILFTNGLTDALAGRKNIAVAILVGILLIVWYHFKDKINTPGWLTHRLPYLLILVSGFFYTNHKVQFAIFSVSIFALSFIPDVHRQASPEQRKRLWMIYIMGFFPTCFLVMMAFRSGHTFGLQQRYSGFSFPYIIILISLLLQYYATLKTEFKLLIFVFMGAQMYFVGMRLQEFYEDRSTKYGYFANPREPNPYHAAAKKIEAMYQEGDTVFYPAPRYEITSEMDRTYLPYSIHDAQLTNLYFPKNARYVQAMDTTQTERIWLKKRDSAEPVEIMKLKGLRYGFE